MPVTSLRDRQPATALPAARAQSLPEQLGQLQRIERELDARLRREAVELKCAAERKVADAHAAFERQLSEEVARLELVRHEAIASARDEYHAKLGDLERLLRQRAIG
jgi:hypothetical protein